MKISVDRLWSETQWEYQGTSSGVKPNENISGPALGWNPVRISMDQLWSETQWEYHWTSSGVKPSENIARTVHCNCLLKIVDFRDTPSGNPPRISLDQLWSETQWEYHWTSSRVKLSENTSGLGLEWHPVRTSMNQLWSETHSENTRGPALGWNSVRISVDQFWS